MKYDLQPSKEVVGGALSSGAELDTEFVSTLRTACLQFIRKKEQTTVHDVEEFVRSVNISKVRLETEDVQQVINSLLYDCAIERVPESAASTGNFFAGKRRRVNSSCDLAIDLLIRCFQCYCRELPSSGSCVSRSKRVTMRRFLVVFVLWQPSVMMEVTYRPLPVNTTELG